MTRSKKIFRGLAVLFLVFLLALIYDISHKTTFPGSRRPSQGKKQDKLDTAKSNLTPKSTTHQP